jgi:accessory secretory protein Asp3
MARTEIQTVRWGDPNSRAALYGTALTMTASGDVHLVNRLMPGGTTLQEWYSFTDYQAVREAPVLPLLQRGRTYRIEPRIVSVPADAFFLEVRFLDRFDAVLRTEVLYAPDYAFDYPTDCHHYTIRLVNGGCDELHFTSLTLLEVDNVG